MQFGDLVSVVVPVFNRAHLIAHTVGSLCQQSYKNLEIIVVDDCSSDEISAAVAAMCDSRIRLIQRDLNGGAAAARNTGVAAARGEWIAFSDSDDICVFDRIEREVAALLALPQDYVAVYCTRLFYSDLDEPRYYGMVSHVRPFPTEKPLSGDLSYRTLSGNIINLPTLLVRKTALLDAGPMDELLRNNEDWDLCIRLTRQGKIGFIAEPLYLTPTALSSKVSEQRISRSARYSAQSFTRITGKIRRAGFVDDALSRHYTSTAGHFMRLGRAGFARRFLRAALAITPLAPKLWVHYLLSYTPRLRKRLQGKSRAHL